MIGTYYFIIIILLAARGATKFSVRAQVVQCALKKKRGGVPTYLYLGTLYKYNTRARTHTHTDAPGWPARCWNNNNNYYYCRDNDRTRARFVEPLQVYIIRRHVITYYLLKCYLSYKILLLLL